MNKTLLVPALCLLLVSACGKTTKATNTENQNSRTNVGKTGAICINLTGKYMDRSKSKTEATMQVTQTGCEMIEFFDIPTSTARNYHIDGSTNDYEGSGTITVQTQADQIVFIVRGTDGTTATTSETLDGPNGDLVETQNQGGTNPYQAIHRYIRMN